MYQHLIVQINSKILELNYKQKSIKILELGNLTKSSYYLREMIIEMYSMNYKDNNT